MEGIKGMDVVVPWCALILALLSWEQKEEKKNEETKMTSTDLHDQTICTVLEGGRGVPERAWKKRPKKKRQKVRFAATWLSHGIVVMERNFGVWMSRHLLGCWRAKKRSCENDSSRTNLVGQILQTDIWSWNQSFYAIHTIYRGVWSSPVTSRAFFKSLCQFLLLKFSRWETKRRRLWPYSGVLDPLGGVQYPVKRQEMKPIPVLILFLDCPLAILIRGHSQGQRSEIKLFHCCSVVEGPWVNLPSRHF
jgi:hypothetical protein